MSDATKPKKSRLKPTKSRSCGQKLKRPYEPVPGRKPFERQPGESDKMWKGFVTYRDLGEERTIKKAAQAYTEFYSLDSKSPSAESWLQKMSSQWGWRVRVEAWDIELDKHRRRLQLKDIEKMHTRHSQLATSVQSLAAQELQKWLKLSKQDREEREKAGKKVTPLLSVDNVVRALEAAVKLERTSRGEPDTISEERQQISVAEQRDNLKDLLVDEKSLDLLDTVLDRVYDISE